MRDTPPKRARETPEAETGENDLRDEITDMIAYALWLHWKQRPARRDLSATRQWARYATAHLELCGMEWTRKPPVRGHSDAKF